VLGALLDDLIDAEREQDDDDLRHDRRLPREAFEECLDRRRLGERAGDLAFGIAERQRVDPEAAVAGQGDLAFQVAERAAQHQTVRDRVNPVDHQCRRRLHEHALFRRQRLVLVERRRPLVEREEGDELRRQPLAQQRLPRGEIQRPRLVQHRHGVVRVAAEQIPRPIGRHDAALHEEVSERVFGSGRGGHHQLALRPVQDLPDRRLDDGQRAVTTMLQHIARDQRERGDLDPLQTHARSTLQWNGPASVW
jgi:hypothetical protein